MCSYNKLVLLFFLLSLPLFTILLNLEFMRFWVVFLGWIWARTFDEHPYQVNQVDSSQAQVFTLGRICRQTPTSLMNSHIYGVLLFIEIEYLLIESNIPKNHLYKVWDFLEYFWIDLAFWINFVLKTTRTSGLQSHLSQVYQLPFKVLFGENGLYDFLNSAQKFTRQ